MTKFFLIILAIIGIFYIAFFVLTRFAKRYFSKMFGVDFNQKPEQNQGVKRETDEVLYKKDDVVVLKGEAKNNEEE